MEKIKIQEIQTLNGLIKTSSNLKTKLILEENKSVEINQNFFNNEIKDKTQMSSPLMDKKIQNFIPSYIPINTLSDSNNFNLNSYNALISSNDLKSDRKENIKIKSEEILENGLNLDEQNNINENKKTENKRNIIINEEKDEINNDNIKKIKSFIDENKYITKNIIKENNKNEIASKKIQNENDNKLPFGIQIPKDLFDKINYAIDENGNPFNIKKAYNDSSNQTPIALIIQKENKADNYLIDLLGKKISKMEDGYFNYKHNNTRVIIQDFDVQHPELRIYGARNKDILTLNSEDKDENTKKNNNFDNKENDKKYKLMLNKKIVNLKRNSPIKIKNMKSFSNETNADKRIKYNLDRNKNLIINKKLSAISNSTNLTQYTTRRISNNYTINRTNNILNKSSSNNIKHNRSYTLSNSSNNIIKNTYEYNNNTERNKGNKISITPSKEIKNISCISSRINLYNYKKNDKNGGSLNNLNKALNLKNTNIIYRNAKSLRNLTYSKKDENIKLSNYNSLFCSNKSLNTNPIALQNNDIKKNKSSDNISNTINNISNKIKYLQNKINSNQTNKTISIPNTSTVSINNSQISNMSKEYNTFNNYYYMNNLNNNNSIYKRQFKCAILSKEVNDIISGYSTKNNKKLKKNISLDYNNIYNDEMNNNNENKINSFLNGHNLMFQRNKSNFMNESNYFEKTNINNNNIEKANIHPDNCSLCGRSLLKGNKTKDNNSFQNGFNFKRNKISALMNMNHYKTNSNSYRLISDNYFQNANLMNNKNKLYNKDKFNLTTSRNSILKKEENKSQKSSIEYYKDKNKNYKFNFNYSVQNINDND